jgi:fermentation-respiration switch protein FrsA (DUF1100 family)
VSSKFIAATSAAAIIGSALCFFLTGAAFCMATLHVPRNLGRTPPNAAEVSIVAGDKVTLRAWWLTSSNSNGNCVVVLHGIADSRVGSVGFAPMFLNAGYAVLLPDSRAHGTSEGQFVTYGLFEKYDVIAWADWMKRKGCRNLYGLGESLGASTLIQAAAVKPAFAAIVAESPYADLREIAEYRVRLMSRMTGFMAVPLAKAVVSGAVLYAKWVDGLDLRQVSPVRAIVHESTPILLIHGLQDFRTPAWNSQKLLNANPRNSLWLIPNAGHTGAAAATPEEFRGGVRHESGSQAAGRAAQ